MSTSGDEKITYQKAGVDPDKAAAILGKFAKKQSGRPRHAGLLSGIGPFASCFSIKDILKQASDPVLVTCCDGVGTKAKLALDWNAINTLGEDLVAMNVNDLLCAGATPLVFLDYYACGQLQESQLLPLLESIQHGCELANCSLVGGETAEMPGLYSDDDFDLAGFSVGFADRSQLLGPHRVKAGDKLIGIASSGLHSNGYSLVRKIVDKTGIQPDEKTPFGAGTWRECLLKPTTIYVRALSSQISKVHALAHITGGGLYENLPRVLPENVQAVVEEQRWPMTDLFKWLEQQAKLSRRELLSTFNCGVGMIAVVASNEADAFLKHVQTQGIHAVEIGNLVDRNDTTAPHIHWKQ